jgi:hypothetical protein
VPTEKIFAQQHAGKAENIQKCTEFQYKTLNRKRNGTKPEKEEIYFLCLFDINKATNLSICLVF